MELYQAYTDYYGMMELTESMFRYLAETVCGSSVISYNGIAIDFGKPFRRLTMNEAIKEYAGVDFDAVATDEEAKALADQHHIEFEARHTKGDIVNLFFEEYCEKNLIQPTFIIDVYKRQVYFFHFLLHHGGEENLIHQDDRDNGDQVIDKQRLFGFVYFLHSLSFLSCFYSLFFFFLNNYHFN